MQPIEVGPARALSAIETRLARQAANPNGNAAKVHKNEPAVVRNAALDAGAPPVDAERVAVIRKAVESGTYPVVPTKIADAIIAAGMLLRSGKQ